MTVDVMAGRSALEGLPATRDPEDLMTEQSDTADALVLTFPGGLVGFPTA